MATAAKRITMLRAGKPKRKVLLLNPPFPEIGETVTVEEAGEEMEYVVIGSEDTMVLVNVIPRVVS